MNDKKMKEKVLKSYETNDYVSKWRTREYLDFELMMFEKVIELLPEDANILSIGCGSGYHDKYFSESGFNLTGIDFSKRLIGKAKKNNPKARYIISDMEDYEITEKYDLIMALFSIINIPRKRHGAMFKKIHEGLKDYGLFLVTIRPEDVGDYQLKENWCGKDMYFSYYDYETYIQMLTEIGFDLVESHKMSDYGSSDTNSYVILRKRKK